MKTALSEKRQQQVRFAVTGKFSIDAQAGRLTDLSLLTADREAKGWGIWIDQKTLETGDAVVKEAGGRLKAYVTHNHDGPCSWQNSDMDEASSGLNIPGFFSGIGIKGNQLTAGLFEFYDAFKTNFKPQYDQLVEMAQKTPDLLGISIEAWGYLAYVAKDGTEYSAEPDDVELLYNGMPAFRITDLFAAAFVSDPAANDGLFASLSRLFRGKHSDDRQTLATALSKFAQDLAAGESAVPLLAPNKGAASLTQSATMKIIADLKTKYGSDEKKFAQAMLLVGNKPDATMEAIEAGMVQADLTAALSQVTTLGSTVTALTTERDNLKTQVTTLTTERDSWKTKFDTLKASGKDGAIDLGAPTNGAETNPWAEGSVNLTEQARITKADPTKAETLKAAAAGAKTAPKK